MASDYEVLRAGSTPLEGPGMARARFQFVEGLCAADPEQPGRSRRVGNYLETVIAPMLADRTLSDGSDGRIDDRKLRVHRIELTKPRTLKVALGVSHYLAFREPFDREDHENGALQERGERDFEDPWAYFPRNPGVAGLVVSGEGSVFLGARVSPDETGQLNAVAGHLTYRDNIHRVDLIRELADELLEEMGIYAVDVNHARFVGAYGHPLRGDFDFTFIVRTKLSNEYFLGDAWKERRTKEEHESLVELATMNDVQWLLDLGHLSGSQRKEKIMYSTRGALLSLNGTDFESI